MHSRSVFFYFHEVFLSLGCKFTGATVCSTGTKLSLDSNLSQDSASLKVPSTCTPRELMEMAMRKWTSTHGPEEERGQYVLRVSHCLEFLHGDHPLYQYKVSANSRLYQIFIVLFQTSSFMAGI